MLDAFTAYFNKKNHLNFAIDFDAEGYHFGITEFDEELYIINDNTANGNLVMEKVETYDVCHLNSKNILIAMAKEVISDVKDNIMDWFFWDSLDLEDEKSTNEIEERKQLLESKCQKLKNLIEGISLEKEN